MSPFPRAAYASLQRYAPDRRPIAVDLSDNTNRWGTHPGALQAIRQAGPRDLTRYPSVYADALREAVSARFGVPGEAVVTGCGSDDLLDATFRAACDPGEGVGYIPPTFGMVETFARVNGLTLLPVERPRPVAGTGRNVGAGRTVGTGRAAGAGRAVGTERSFADLPDPEALLEGRPGLIYLCRPNNPTGEVQPVEWVDRLLAAAGDADGPIILLDEAYADFMEAAPHPAGGAAESPGGEGGAPEGDPGCESGDPHHFLRRAPTTRRMVVLRTFSKAYGLAGLRVGFAVGDPEVVREIEKARGPYKVTRVSEAAAVAALTDREGWVPGIVAEARKERTYLRAELEARGFRVLPSGANFLFLPLEEGPLDSATAATLTDRLRSSGVAVRPFPAVPGLGEAVRVSVGPRPEMDRLLNALDGMLT
jgi:histidinol-phosphate aminotransferase